MVLERALLGKLAVLAVEAEYGHCLVGRAGRQSLAIAAPAHRVNFGAVRREGLHRRVPDRVLQLDQLLYALS